MGMFTKIPENTFNELQTDAGMLLNTFNPASPAEPNDADIISATTGGITVSCVPTYSDYGEDVDNAPNNTLELKHLDGWDCKISGTLLGTTPELVRLQLGAADVSGDKITPRNKLKSSDFADLWWVGDLADGGFAAVKILNALSTGGFSLKTSKNGKGNYSFEFTGHVSIEDQETMPMEFYVVEGAGGATGTT